MESHRTHIDVRIDNKIPLHYINHVFRTERWKRIEILEVNIIQHIDSMETRPLHMVFIDLFKAYDTVDRIRILMILEEYGLGNNILCLLKSFWSQKIMSCRQSGCYVKPLSYHIGIIHGDVLSPTLFNILADAVLRSWI